MVKKVSKHSPNNKEILDKMPEWFHVLCRAYDKAKKDQDRQEVEK